MIDVASECQIPRLTQEVPLQYNIYMEIDAEGFKDLVKEAIAEDRNEQAAANWKLSMLRYQIQDEIAKGRIERLRERNAKRNQTK